jgi:hypothetical protein
MNLGGARSKYIPGEGAELGKIHSCRGGGAMSKYITAEGAEIGQNTLLQRGRS